MGIKGLFGLLKSIQKPCHLKKFSGQTLAVDGYGWLHRGTVACAIDLVMGKPTTKHIDFVLSRVRMLLYFGVTPYMVFDGDDLPSKSGTEVRRHEKRKESKALGMELYQKGRTAEAYQEMMKAVDVTPLMARQLIEELKKMNVPYVVAPYEADAQLVYLEQHGFVDGILSDDSDLLVFGAKRLLTKLDQHGDLIEVNRADLTACDQVNFVGWTDADFRRMCILSGCDYLPNIPRVGLKTAHGLIHKYKDVEKAVRRLQFDGPYVAPPDYIQKFKQAELTFLYQRVFCAKAGKLVTVTPPDDGVNVDELPFIGQDYDPEIAVGVAQGELDPMTKQPLVLSVKPTWNARGPALNRRQTISASDLKPLKPINSYFIPKRVPLAELDPNSLTPSPSQQRLLHRHANTSWEPSPAPSRPSLVRSAPANGSSNRVSSPLVRSVERSSFLARASKPSALQPIKRQRLCSDMDESSPVNTPGCRSRFFADISNDNTPSGGQKLNRNKKPRKSTLDVFSDDMAEDIMSQIPDPGDTPDKSLADLPARKTVENKSKKGNQDDGPRIGRDTESPKARNAERTRDGVLESVTPSKTVCANSETGAFHQVLDHHIKRQNATLSKFTFRADAGGTSRDPQLSDRTNGSGPGKTQKVDKQGTATPLQPKRLTPLQRLGQNALARSRSLNSISTPPSIWRSPNRFEPKSSTSPRASSTAAGPSPSQGSEDLIVPDNEEEDDCDTADGADPKPQVASLDFKRFAFTTD